MYIYLAILCGFLTIYSPNNVALDSSDGGRALLYILCFGTAVMVLQLQIGHLTGKDYNPNSSAPFMIAIVLLTLNSFFILLPSLDFVGMRALELPMHWYLAITLISSKYFTSDSVWLFVRIVQQLCVELDIDALSNAK